MTTAGAVPLTVASRIGEAVDGIEGFSDGLNEADFGGTADGLEVVAVGGGPDVSSLIGVARGRHDDKVARESRGEKGARAWQ